MAYSDNFPAVRPVFQSDFANGGRIDPRMTFSRASIANVWDGSKHLSSENLIAYSSDISQSAWTKNGVTETGGQAAPDGGTNAYKLTEDSATGFHRIYYASPVLSSGSLTVSCYVKYIGRQWVYLRMRDAGANYRHVWFDVQNGTKGTEETNMTGSITASGGGYYKLTATVSSVHAASADVRIGGANADGNTQYAGSGSDAFAVWGIQANTTGETVLNETSGQIHREYAPTLQTASINAPRFEHSATDSASMGLLIEGSSTNLLNYSEQFDNAYWSKYNAPVTANAGVAPSGQLVGDLLVGAFTGSSTNHYLAKAVSFTSGTTYTLSVYVKAAGYTKFNIRAGNPAVWGVGTTFTLTGSGSASVTSGYGAIEACGNGWFRCSVTEAAASTSATNVLLGLVDNSGNLSFDGDDYSGVLLWGAMLEAGASHPSSYIKVEGSTVTRASDSASAVTSDIGYTGGPVSVVGEVSFNADLIPSSATVVQLTSTVGNDRAYIYRDGGNETLWGVIQSDGGYPASANLLGAASVSGTNYKFAFSADTNDYKAVVNNGTVHTDTAMQLPNQFDKLAIGYNFHGGAQQINGHYKRLAIYSNGMTSANVSALTK